MRIYRAPRLERHRRLLPACIRLVKQLGQNAFPLQEKATGVSFPHEAHFKRMKPLKEADAQKYGVSKLGLLLEYETLAHAGPISGDPGKAKVHVPSKDGSVADRLFANCTVADLNSAIKSIKGNGQAALPKADAKTVLALQSALDAALGKGKLSLKAHVRGRSTVVILDNIPLAQLKTVADALKSA